MYFELIQPIVLLWSYWVAYVSHIRRALRDIAWITDKVTVWYLMSVLFFFSISLLFSLSLATLSIRYAMENFSILDAYTIVYSWLRIVSHRRCSVVPSRAFTRCALYVVPLSLRHIQTFRTRVFIHILVVDYFCSQQRFQITPPSAVLLPSRWFACTSRHVLSRTLFEQHV